MAEAKAVQVKKPAQVKVQAKFPPFIDLVNDVTIGSEPVSVDMHPWLQANIDSGLLVICS